MTTTLAQRLTVNPLYVQNSRKRALLIDACLIVARSRDIIASHSHFEWLHHARLPHPVEANCFSVAIEAKQLINTILVHTQNQELTLTFDQRATKLPHIAMDPRERPRVEGLNAIEDIDLGMCEIIFSADKCDAGTIGIMLLEKGFRCVRATEVTECPTICIFRASRAYPRTRTNSPYLQNWE